MCGLNSNYLPYSIPYAYNSIPNVKMKLLRDDISGCSLLLSHSTYLNLPQAHRE